MEATLSDRAQHLLRILIKRYIRDGQPVGSKTLAEEGQIALSSATIRNIMAELEERGYLASPHTSAGRVPTQQAYRFFVDSLLTINSAEIAELSAFKEQLTTVTSQQASANKENALRAATSLLSGITQLAGIVSLPKQEMTLLTHVEFLALAGNRVLVILVLNENDVQNRIMTTERTYTPTELQQISNYINAHFAGLPLSSLHDHMVDALQRDRQDMEGLMRSVISVAAQAFEARTDEQLLIEGQTKLLDIGEGTDMQRLRALFEAFTEKREILYLLDKCLAAKGVQIYIGGESGFDMLDDFSVITAPYEVAGKLAGVLGVIGPTRMSYDRVIPMVDITAKILSAILNKAD